MKRAIVNFSKDYDYELFKRYADGNNISLSRAILDLASKALDDWEDQRLGDIALERLHDPNAEYISSDKFWEKALEENK